LNVSVVDAPMGPQISNVLHGSQYSLQYSYQYCDPWSARRRAKFKRAPWIAILISVLRIAIH